MRTGQAYPPTPVHKFCPLSDPLSPPPILSLSPSLPLCPFQSLVHALPAQGLSAVTKGVKNLMSTTRQSMLGVTVDAIVNNKPGTEQEFEVRRPLRLHACTSSVATLSVLSGRGPGTCGWAAASCLHRSAPHADASDAVAFAPVTAR